MELKDFIKTTLLELSEAIDESGVELDKKISLTNTTIRAKQMGDYGLVDFDLAVEIKDSQKVDKGGRAKIAIAQADLGKSSEKASSTTSRIKFTIEADLDSKNARFQARQAKQ